MDAHGNEQSLKRMGFYLKQHLNFIFTFRILP